MTFPLLDVHDEDRPIFDGVVGRAKSRRGAVKVETDLLILDPGDVGEAPAAQPGESEVVPALTVSAAPDQARVVDPSPEIASEIV